MPGNVVIVKTWKEHKQEEFDWLLLKMIGYGFLAIIPMVFFFILFMSISNDFYKSIRLAIIVGAIADVLFLLRKRIKGWFSKRRNRKKHRREFSGWERISKLPNWAFRRMNRKHKDKVRGKHYIYMRHNKKFYRKRYA